MKARSNSFIVFPHLAALLCLAALLVSGAARGDTKPDSTYGSGGTKTTETSSYEDKTQVDTTSKDAKGNTRETNSEVSGPNGKVTTNEKLTPDGKKISSDRKETDASGKETGGMSEKYDENGVLVSGSSWQTDPSGKKYYKVWNPKTGKYEPVPPSKSGDVEYVDGEGNYHHLVVNPQTKQLEETNKPKYTEYENNQPKKQTIIRLNADGKLEIVPEGTGQTIGHIGNLRIRNTTAEPVSCVVPAMVLESRSGQSQNYVCPHPQDVALGPNETKTVPIDGVCVNRDKPPVGNGQTGDLVMNSGDPGIPKNPDCHIPADKARDLVRMCESKYHAADKLVNDGLKDFPYNDKQKQKDILVQWSTWEDPRICDITGAPPASKNDLKKVVYKQLDENGPISSDRKKKIDKGIDTIFDKIELTTAKAKDLEEPDTYAQAGTGNTFEISDEQGQSNESPQPGTQEKKKKGGKGGKKDKGPKRPKPIQDWIDKKMEADKADRTKDWAHDNYNDKKQEYFKKNKHHEELVEKIKKIQGVLSSPLNSNSAEQNDKLIKERDDAKKELTKLEGELQKDFNQTDEGKKAFGEINEADKAADKAHAVEKEAGKNIDPAIKDELEKSGATQPVPAVW